MFIFPAIKSSITISLKALAVTLLALVLVFTSIYTPKADALSPQQRKLYNKSIYYYEVDACGSQSGGSDNSGTPAVDGSIQDLAKQVLKDGNIDKDSGRVVREDLEEAAAGKPSVGNNKLNKSVLVLLLEIAKKYKVSISSVTGNGTGHSSGSKHYEGLAVDIQSLDGTATNGSDAAAQKIVDTAGKVLPKGSSFGLGSNPNSINLPAGMSAFSDAPNHVHIQVPSGSNPDTSSTNSQPRASAKECCEDGAASATQLVGHSNAEKAYNYLMAQSELGLKPAQAAGIIGNMMRESGGDTVNLNPDITGNGMCANGSDCYGIVQWGGGRVPAMRAWAAKQNKDPKKLETQLGYVKFELLHGYKGTLNTIKSLGGENEGTARASAKEFNATFEVGANSDIRQNDAARFFNKYVKGKPAPDAGSASSSSDDSSGSASCGSSSTGDAELKNTIKVDKPGKFIDLPSKYGCGGSKHKIDSRIAAGVAYLVTKYNMCITAGLEDGHKSHGAGLAIDVVPKKGSSKSDWKESTEAAARAIGWYGDSADDPKGSKSTCGDSCMYQVHPDKFPKWARWIGYNGAACHGDRWHVEGCGAHLHIGWASPNGGDATSSGVISKPIPAVYTFQAPVPDDLKNLVD